MSNLARVRARLAEVGYSEQDIDRGIAYAAARGGDDADEGLSLATSRILYGDEDLGEGARFAVEPGSVDWSAY